MKKVILSLSVVVAFSAYAFFQRQSDISYVAPGNKQSQSGAPTIDANSQGVTPTQPPGVSSSRSRHGEDDEEEEDGATSRTTSGQNTSPAVTTPTPTQPPTQSTTPVPNVPRGVYKDGTYTGSIADAYYGNVQVRVVISSGRIIDVQFLDYPQDRNTSIEINTRAMPMLKSEAIQAQNANVDTVSGATETSGAFRQSLTAALVQAGG